MNEAKVLRAGFSGAHTWYNGTVPDITAEQTNNVPPGVGSTIGALIAHILNTEDFMINTAIQGKPTIWEAEGWGAKLGCEMIVGQERVTARASYATRKAWQDTGERSSRILRRFSRA